jgi:putative ABC transport system permease protein
MTAWRQAWHNRLLTLLHIGGLSIGTAAAIIIAFYVRNETAFDDFLKDKARVYRIEVVENHPDQPIKYDVASQPQLAAVMAAEISGLTGIARLTMETVALRRGDTEALDTVGDADPNFLTVLGVPVWQGDPATALSQPNSLVLTRDMSIKYFGKESSIGETLEVNRKYPIQVTAVLENFPANTHLTSKIFISSKSNFTSLALYESRGRSFGSDFTTNTYMRLGADADAKLIEAELAALAKRHIAKDEQTGETLSYVIDPVSDLHLDPRGHDPAAAGRLVTVMAIGLIGVLLLLVSMINFVNLMTARAGRRAVEVGVRKAVGATYAVLIAQFLSETMAYAVAATALGAGLAAFLLPSVNALIDQQLSFAYLRDPFFAGCGLLAVVVIGLAAGIYPALLLSSFQPVVVLKYVSTGLGGNARLRQGLVVLQFAVSISLIIATGIIYRQSVFANRESITFDHDQIAVHQATSRSDRAVCRDEYKQRLLIAPGILGVTCSHAAPLDFAWDSRNITLPDGSVEDLRIQTVDFDFFELYGIRPLAGRSFERARGTDALSTDPNEPMAAPVIVNESMVQHLGLPNPQAAIGREITIADVRDQQVPVPIIGVIPDFQIESIREPIKPTVFFVDPNDFILLSVRLDSRHFSDGVASLDRIIAEANPGRPPSHTFLDDEIARRYLGITREAQIFAAFAAISVVIACLGLIGLSAHTAERRTKEIGIRKALGASTFDVARLLIWQFVQPVLVANFLAWPVVWWVMRAWLAGFAYRIEIDPLWFLSTGVMAILLAAATTGFHAIQVSRSRPVLALRYE